MGSDYMTQILARLQRAYMAGYCLPDGREFTIMVLYRLYRCVNAEGYGQGEPLKGDELK